MKNSKLKMLLAWTAAFPFLARAKTQFANVGEGTRESGHDSLIFDAGGATANAAALAANTTSKGRYLLYKKSTDADHITVCGLNDVSVGICQDAYDANNADVPVNVALHGCAPGTQRVVTDGTITDGIPIKAGANGQATAATTGDAGIFGRAYLRVDTTANAGDVITCVTEVPSKMSF
jgi:hypothetical protein